VIVVKSTVTLILTVLIMVLLPMTSASARPAVDPPAHNSVQVEPADVNQSGGTDWLLVGAAAVFGVLVVGGTAYAVTHTGHRPAHTH
jgi:hypothetical protein